MHVSTYSFAALTRSCAPLLTAAGGGSVVGVDFDARQVWPGYDWMGVAEAGSESCCRYLAHTLGPPGDPGQPGRRRPAADHRGHRDRLLRRAAAGLGDRARLEWDTTDADPVGGAICALWSDWLPKVIGEVLHVNGGMRATGAGGIRQARVSARAAAGAGR